MAHVDAEFWTKFDLGINTDLGDSVRESFYYSPDLKTEEPKEPPLPTVTIPTPIAPANNPTTRSTRKRRVHSTTPSKSSKPLFSLVRKDAKLNVDEVIRNGFLLRDCYLYGISSNLALLHARDEQLQWAVNSEQTPYSAVRSLTPRVGMWHDKRGGWLIDNSVTSLRLMITAMMATNRIRPIDLAVHDARRPNRSVLTIPTPRASRNASDLNDYKMEPVMTTTSEQRTGFDFGFCAGNRITSSMARLSICDKPCTNATLIISQDFPQWKDCVVENSRYPFVLRSAGVISYELYQSGINGMLDFIEEQETIVVAKPDAIPLLDALTKIHWWRMVVDCTNPAPVIKSVDMSNISACNCWILSPSPLPDIPSLSSDIIRIGVTCLGLKNVFMHPPKADRVATDELLCKLVEYSRSRRLPGL